MIHHTIPPEKAAFTAISLPLSVLPQRLPHATTRKRAGLSITSSCPGCGGWKSIGISNDKPPLFLMTLRIITGVRAITLEQLQDDLRSPQRDPVIIRRHQFRQDRQRLGVHPLQRASIGLLVLLRIS